MEQGPRPESMQQEPSETHNDAALPPTLRWGARTQRNVRFGLPVLCGKTPGTGTHA